jgi:hypothetical protein
MEVCMQTDMSIQETYSYMYTFVPKVTFTWQNMWFLILWQKEAHVYKVLLMYVCTYIPLSDHIYFYIYI